MEQYSKYLMWINKPILNSHFQTSFNSLNSSWEEQAFAEDAARPLGGFIWPPRSYSCSFCRREFMSAQALGGHMNVHRRDRARLKQSLSPENEGFHYKNHSPSLSKSSGTQYSSQICTSYSNPSFLSDCEAAKLFSISELKVECEKKTKKEEHVFLGHEDYVETNLSVGLNLTVSQNQLEESNGGEKVNYKRLKSTAVALPFLLKPMSSERYSFQSEVVGIKISSMEDIDLELRLGDPPTVK